MFRYHRAIKNTCHAYGIDLQFDDAPSFGNFKASSYAKTPPP
jgi:hypothetical protein